MSMRAVIMKRFMALFNPKKGFIILSAISTLTMFVLIILQSEIMKMDNRHNRIEESSLSPIKKSGIMKMDYRIEESSLSPIKKESKWERCKKLISGEENVNKTSITKNDFKILDVYKPDENCDNVLHTRFAHPNVTKEETKLPIAYGFTIYKGASLFERILRAIYMPHNVHCIHIDKKSPEVFYRAIQAMIRCLPNVFIAAKRVDVVWGHFSIVQAQLECMKELLESSVKWKYYISLIGQDFPLYENKQIVVALKMLNNTNSMESFPMPKHNEERTKKVHILNGGLVQRTGTEKSPPPHNVSIYKGSTHIVVIRDFVRFVLYSKVGKDFTEFLKDTFVPDETIYASLQQNPQAPGGIRGEQPEHITRALQWYDGRARCYGEWIRTLCWLSVKDLQWALGKDMKNKLFVHKIPFDHNKDILECLLVARQGREYGFDVWNASATISQDS